jgi:ferredoxin
VVGGDLSEKTSEAIHRVSVEGFARFTAKPNEILLQACERAGVPMESACGGFAACNSCRIEVLSGASELSPLLSEELPFLDSKSQRLGCQVRILGDVEVRLVPECH